MLQEQLFGSVKVLSVNLEQLIKALKDASFQIKEQIEGVESLYLFGSFARGDYTPHSDIDLLIIVSQTERPYLERRDQFIDFFNVPFDVNPVVYTSGEIKKMRAEGSMFLRNIWNEAIQLV